MKIPSLRKIFTFRRSVIGGVIFLPIFFVVAVIGIAYAMNMTAGGENWFGPGTIIVIGFGLCFIITIVALAWWLLRNVFTQIRIPASSATQPTATITSPLSPTPNKSKWTAWRIIKWVFILGFVSGICQIIGMYMLNPRENVSISSLFAPPPQPQGRCDDSFDQDDLGIYNFSQSPKDRVVVNPGSTTKLCYGSLVSIPEDRWKTWGAQFVKPARQKERCVAYFSYIYPDQHVITLGPRYEQELGIGNMSGTWRIATNCPIEYYRW